MEKNTIKLNESRLRQIVAEAITKIVDRGDFETPRLISVNPNHPPFSNGEEHEWVPYRGVYYGFDGKKTNSKALLICEVADIKKGYPDKLQKYFARNVFVNDGFKKYKWDFAILDYLPTRVDIYSSDSIGHPTNNGGVSLYYKPPYNGSDAEFKNF